MSTCNLVKEEQEDDASQEGRHVRNIASLVFSRTVCAIAETKREYWNKFVRGNANILSYISSSRNF